MATAKKRGFVAPKKSATAPKVSAAAPVESAAAAINAVLPTAPQVAFAGRGDATEFPQRA